VTCGFQALFHRLSSYERQFYDLTLLQEGFSQGGKPLDIVGRLHSDGIWGFLCNLIRIGGIEWPCTVASP